MASAVILDLDGTVWDSHPFYAAVAGGSSAAERKRVLAQLKAGASAATLLKAAGVTTNSLRKLCARNGSLSFYTDALTTIAGLSEQGTPLGVVTNLPTWIVAPMLECHGLDEMLTSVVTWGRAARRKPHPDPLLLCCKELKVATDDDCWYVGDTDSDGLAAQRAGLSFGWASWGYGTAAPADSASLTGFADVAGL
jgi:phosphoglycolate phosphatase